MMIINLRLVVEWLNILLVVIFYLFYLFSFCVYDIIVRKLLYFLFCFYDSVVKFVFLIVELGFFVLVLFWEFGKNVEV